MKLDEVAGTKALKCGLIMPAGGNESLDAGDWHGSTEVYTNQAAFIKAVKNHYLEYVKMFADDEDEAIDESEVSAINKAKSMDDLSELDSWNNFVDNIWIDDRF